MRWLHERERGGERPCACRRGREEAIEWPCGGGRAGVGWGGVGWDGMDRCRVVRGRLGRASPSPESAAATGVVFIIPLGTYNHYTGLESSLDGVLIIIVGVVIIITSGTHASK
jgi:hypothetical protein